MFVLLPIVLVVVIWSWPAVWVRIVQGRLDMSVEVDKDTIDIGGALMIRVRVVNRSWFPCPYVQLILELPEGLSASRDRWVPGIQRSTWLLMRQEAVFDIECFGWRRGLADLHHRSAILRMNEGFGLREMFLSREVRGQVVVQPMKIAMAETVPAMRDINGELERMRWLLPDEAYLRGIRAYETGDPFKHIAWQASARTGSWMTKQFSSSTDVSVLLVMNAQFFDLYWWGTHVAKFDQLASVTVSIAESLERQRIPVYFCSNAIYPGKTRQQWYGRLGVSSLRTVLGSMLPYASTDFSRLFPLFHRHVSNQIPLVLVTSAVTREQVRLLQAEARRRRVIVMTAADDEIPHIDGIETVRFRPFDVHVTAEEDSNPLPEPDTQEATEYAE